MAEKKSTKGKHGNRHSTQVNSDPEQKKTCTGCGKCHHGYFGAGILVVVPSRFDPKKKDVLLAQSSGSGKYNDFGGSIDLKTDARISVTASREAFEETIGLVDVEASDIREKNIHLDFWKDGHIYRCYVLDYSDRTVEPPITPSKFKASATSVQALVKSGVKVPYRFLETKSVGRFPLDDIKKIVDLNTGQSCVDLKQKTWNDDGKYVDVLLHSRVARVLNRVLEMYAKRK